MRQFRNVLVTGGAGFVGGNFIRYLLAKSNFGGTVTNLDKLTYAANSRQLEDFQSSFGERYRFVRADVADPPAVEEVLAKHDIDAVVHFAAESHVDRSIAQPEDFLRTNIQGTYTLLQAARKVWGPRNDVLFHHISTDEVFGSLEPSEKSSETSAYAPRSPYSASKAASDHLVSAWHHTYGLPVTISHCGNNYGPFQHSEKLIPLVISKLLAGKPLPLYGDGQNVRDWLYVEDHASAVWAIISGGRLGESYNIGAENEWKNIDLVGFLCRRLAELQGKSAQDYLNLIAFVPDRPGHDRRYALDGSKLKRDLQWAPRFSFEHGLDATLRWHLEQ